MPDDALLQDLGRLRDALVGADLSLPLTGSDEAAGTRDEAIAQIEDYLIPRLSRLDAPLLAVLGGSTGSGKSTLTNSLVGRDVSTAGVLRPTTRAPVLVCHPDDEAWFTGEGVLPDLPRTTGERGTGHALHLVTSAEVPQGLGLLDSPDIDSIETANHDLAAQLLGAADLWLFVTTAARYADAVPWDYLARASERAAAVALIVNRIPPTPGAVADISADVHRMLTEAGLPYAKVFAIEEVPLADGRLSGAEGEVRAWIGELVADAESRAEVIRSTVQGAVDSLPVRVERVEQAMATQVAAVQAMRDAAEVTATAAVRRVAAELGSGVLLRGEVLDRFREQVGTAEWMHKLQQGVGRFRDRVRSFVTGDTVPVAAAQGQLRSNLVGLVDDGVSRSVEETVQAWQHLPGGATVLGGVPTVRSDIDRIEASMSAWQDTVVALVREKAGSKLTVARGLSLGVNGIGVALMMTVFAATGGLTGGEVAVAGGTAAVSQAILTAVFGEQAVRDLANAARADLLERVRELVDERQRALATGLEGLGGHDRIAALQDAARAVRR
jgi:energy-coupling factor transporter ATP-binding protein EcfA2